MRIAYLVNQYPMVSHTFIRREIAAVEAVGTVEVSRYSLRRGAQGYVDPADRVEAQKTWVVLDQGAIGLALATLRVALGRPRAFVSAFALAVAVGRRSHRGLLRNLIYLAEACVLLEAFREAGIDHVHAHFGTNAAAIAMLCRAIGGPPYSFTIHGPLEFDVAPLLALAEKIARAEFVVAITSFCRSQIFRNCPEKDWPKVHVVPCGVDASFLARSPEPIPSASRLVFVGRLSDHKAPGLLVEAVSRLRRRGIPCELTFAGDGELRSDIEREIARLGLADRVRVTGFADEAAVRDYIAESRALVLPSFGEGLPVVLMEALALGRPVVSTYVAGIPELVESGTSGWLVPASSLDDLTAALQEVLEAPVERLEAMGREGRRRVVEHYDVAKSGRRLVELFRASAGSAKEPCAADARERWPSLTALLATQGATWTGVLAAWFGCAAFFAARQEIWVDETTQLSGLTLDPAEVSRWLAGVDPSRFGVPGDRSPPLSYWLGWLWSQAFTAHENSMRVFGMVCVALGLVLLVRAARRAAGPTAGWIAGLTLALSPNLIVAGVEVRSYPLFFALACALVAVVLDLLATREPRPRQWLALTAVSTLISYTHFFGLVAAGAAFVATAPWPPFDARQLRRWLLSGAATGIAAAGLVPFVLAAMRFGGEAAPEATGAGLAELARSLVRLAYRLAGGHPAVAVERPVMALVLSGAIGLFGLALFGADERPRRLVQRLALGLGAGLAAIFAAKLVSTQFDALGANYNLWAVPWIVGIIGIGAAALRPSLHRLQIGLACTLIAGNAAATAVLLAHAESFAHTASERLLAEIEDKGGPSAVAVLHAGEFGYAYFPLHFGSGGQLAQYTIARDPTDGVRIQGLSLRGDAAPATLASLSADRMLLITSRAQGAEEIRSFLHGRREPRLADPELRREIARTGLKSAGGRTLMALGASEFEWFER